MSSKYEEIDLSKIRKVPFKDRGSKVSVSEFGDPVKGGKSFRKWFDSLPGQLAADRMRRLVLAIRRAYSGKNHQIIWMIGAHLIKCGLSPYLIELMKRGYITTLAMNGACLIHDLEIAFFSKTSEDVSENLNKGIFGFCEETGSLAFRAVREGAEDGLGLGESLGRFIIKNKAPWKEHSLLGQAYRHSVPASVHVAFGTDILHQHSEFDGGLWGGLTSRDFRIFSNAVYKLGDDGGVALNIGSAVILPEVFLKAVSIGRNLGAKYERITTCNMDMSDHYRPSQNVLARPASFGGEAISLTGHHELMLPILYSAILS